MAGIKNIEAPQAPSENVLNPDWEVQRRADEAKYLKQYCLDLAVKLENANAAYQDPEVLTQRVLDTAERFRMYILPENTPMVPDIND